MEYFETGTATDVNNALGKLRTAMQDHGWTVNYNDYEGSSGGIRCHMSKDGMTVNLRSGFNNEVPVANANERSTRQGAWNWTSLARPDWIALNMGTGVNLSRSWHNQPGAPASSELRGLGHMVIAFGAISRYWIFILENPDMVMMVIELQPGKFETLAFGRLILNQEVESGGEFCGASRPFNSTITRPYEFGDAIAYFTRLVDSRWATLGDQLDGWGLCISLSGVANALDNTVNAYGIPTGASYVNSPTIGGYRNVLTESYLDLEGRSILYPIAHWKQTAIEGRTLLGYIPHVGRTSMKPYLAGDEVVGVGESYLAFPHHRRTSPWSVTDYGTSGQTAPLNDAYNYYGTGFAVRKP